MCLCALLESQLHPPRSRQMKLTVEVFVKAPLAQVWKAWTTPADIVQWNSASDDWHTTSASVDLTVGGSFTSRMEAKDGSMGFDFAGIYTAIIEQQLIEGSFGRAAAVGRMRAGNH